MLSFLARHSFGKLIVFSIVLSISLLALIRQLPIEALRYINPIGRYVFFAAMMLFLFDVARERGWIKHRQLPNWITSIDRRYTIAASCASAFALCFLVLLASWTNGGTQDYSAVGGLVPYNDAAAYFEGAEQLLQDGTFTNFSERRPLNVAFFAARLLVADENIYWAIILQAMIAALALYLASLQMYRLVGTSNAAVFFAINFAFLSSCLPRTLSEPLGISLGLLAFTLYCSSIVRRSKAEYALATLILTLALLARAGAMFALAASTLFAVLFFAGSWRARCLVGAMTIAAITTGWLINALLVKIYGTGGAMLSNFSYVLYGLSQGGKGWLQAVADLPNLSGNEQQMAKALYQKAFESILSNPLLLVSGIIMALWKSVASFPIDLLTLLGDGSDGGLPASRLPAVLASVLLIPPLLFGAWQLVSRRPFVVDALQWFLLLQLIAFIASLPFFYLDGRIRLAAATFPFTAGAIVLILAGCKRFSNLDGIVLDRIVSRYAGVIAILVVVASVAAPRFAQMRPPRGTESVSCETPDIRLQMLVGTGTAHVNVLDDGKRSELPNIRRSDFRISDNSEIQEFWKNLSFPATILIGLDHNSRRSQFLVGPPGFADGPRRLASLCATPLSHGVLSYRPVMKVD
ncbi:hypothetical protein [Bradyrhizobium sp. JYMT SZCCT0428]|uniref:hypothetical protein n=1 Tax=Bradyrhizobium sp. JYMT SZCCT0428 TaxID=2807673 RepID=UPI001BA98C3F|nr:hypothetical protein [Bradyrhizobium sp. JYMT SZCCT0428]MBR1157292.1 hypothetical protein [Bradyrhizobium sp. JYMT SZCCT0428]